MFSKISIFFQKLYNVRWKSNYNVTAGLSNKKVFEKSLTAEINRSLRYNLTFSILLLDIKHFEIINNIYGHDVGDQVLKHFMNLVNNLIQKNDLFSKIGSKRFAVIAPQRELQSALKLAEKICEEIVLHTFNTVANITLSIGVAQYTPHETKKQFFKRAGNALHRAKRQGGNRVESAL
jgi:two-component system, cell cycle response regulator